MPPFRSPRPEPSSSNSQCLPLLPSIQGWSRIASAVGTACGPLPDPTSTDPASTDALSYLDTYGNIVAAFGLRSAIGIVKHDRVKRRLAGALLDADAPDASPWGRKPFNPRKVAKRILACHAAWLVLRKKTTHEVVLLPNYCNAIPCPVCARRKTARYLERTSCALADIAPTLRLRWITLTLRNIPVGDLKAMILQMIAAFRELRKSRTDWSPWHIHVRGHIWSIEVTLNQKKQSWHPHIHIVYDGDYMPIHSLNTAWQRAMGSHPSRAIIGDCYYLDDGQKKTLSGTSPSVSPTSRAKHITNAVAEIVKYQLKPFESSETSLSAIYDLMSALHNQRLKGSGGTMRIPALPNAHAWQSLGGLHSIFDPSSRNYIDDDNLFEKILAYAQAKPALWFNLVRFWSPAYWLERADHSEG